MASFDWLVVGAGFTGATVARRLAEQFGARVLVIDGRSHVAGNAYDSREPSGELVHRYGPHVFHTNSSAIVAFLSRFTEWSPYQHKVRVSVDGQLIPLPVGFAAINQLLPAAGAERLMKRLTAAYGTDARSSIHKLRASTDSVVRDFAELVFEKIFLNYSRKQWGCDPSELDDSVLARVPIAISHDDRYFADRFQALPKHGYAELFRRMLDHPGIVVKLGARYEQLPDEQRALRTVYTGAIDRFFDFDYGQLPYRSMEFEFAATPRPRMQPCATVNHPAGATYIRSTEQPWLNGTPEKAGTMILETPVAHDWGRHEPHYPVPKATSRQMARQYFQAAERLRGRVWFAGRLGDYTYYNMDQACARAHALVDKELRSGA